MTTHIPLPPNAIKELQQEILSWYAEHQRDLPWRKDRDPYHILVSEIMSQQTQINRVVPKYEAWMEKFPTIESLADTETSEVLRYWSGLGYNRRAINLQRTAQLLVSEYSESQKVRQSDSQTVRESESSEFSTKVVWPRTVEELKKLPGIGEYTASAIACFAFNEQIAVIDTNVRKVILVKFPTLFTCLCEEFTTKQSHKLDCRASLAMTGITIKTIASQLLPRKALRLRSGRLVSASAYEWNQALMDYAGAMLKHEKITVPKQSKFKDSNRYYRGQIVKLLLEHQGVSSKSLAELLKKDVGFTEKIVKELVKDGLVTVNNSLISFA